MKANHQFSIAVHIMSCLGSHPGSEITSQNLALSINTSASFIRRTLAKLSKASLVRTTKGKGGSICLAKNAKEISMLDIYRAVEAPEAFAIHQYPQQALCTVSCSFKPAMRTVLDKAQKGMEDNLKKVSLAEVVGQMAKA